MFTFKKTGKDLPNVDITEIHSTTELHIMNADDTTSCTCCKKPFKDGDKCQISNVNGKMKVNHEACE